jgi:hypothetical protein
MHHSAMGDFPSLFSPIKNSPQSGAKKIMSMLQTIPARLKRLMDKKRKICNCKSCYCDWDIPKYKITEYNWLKEWTKEDILKLRKL